MRSKVVPVKNVLRLAAAGESLIKRSSGMPGIGLVHGETGYGKSTAVDWYANKCNAVYVRAMATWTPSAMLNAIAKELRLQAKGSCAQMMDAIIERLAFARRPVFVDEADYIVDSKRMTESLRDLHDLATVPVILVGMGEIEQKLGLRKQFTGRIMQSVEFEPLNLADARTLANELAEVKVRDDLLEVIHQKAAGACRNIVVSLAEVERTAQARDLDEIGLADWDKSSRFFVGEAPRANVTPLRASK